MLAWARLLLEHEGLGQGALRQAAVPGAAAAAAATVLAVAHIAAAQVGPAVVAAVAGEMLSVAGQSRQEPLGPSHLHKRRGTNEGYVQPTYQVSTPSVAQQQPS